MFIAIFTVNRLADFFLFLSFSLLECGALLVLLRWCPAVYDPHEDSGEVVGLKVF